MKRIASISWILRYRMYRLAGRRKDGIDFSAEASISKVTVERRNLYTVIPRDITERVAAEEKIEASLREKEALLKEVHHR